MRNGIWLVCFAIAGALAGPVGAEFPERPLRMLVPAGAGDGSDIQVRIVAEQASKFLGQTIVIENRPGGGGVIAAREAARANPDGYTLLMGTNASQVFAPILNPDAGYDVERSFVPIVRISRSPMVMAVPRSLEVSDLQGFLRLARDRADPLNFASGGSGTLMHLSGEFLQKATGIRMVHVPYKGASPGLVDLMQGRVAAMFVPVHNILGLADGSRVKVLMVADSQRLARLPEVPTAAESGLSDFTLVSWSGIFAPARTPQAVVARLGDEFLRAVENPSVVEAIRRRGSDIEPQRQVVFASFMRAEAARYRTLLRDMRVDR